MRQPLPANELRRLAEGADGQRGSDMVLAEFDSEVLLTSEDQANQFNWPILLRLRTNFEGPGVNAKKLRVALLHDNEILELDEKVDAVFLTQSAVGKFVLPYYTRHCQPKEIQQLRDDLFDNEINVAAQHVPPSITSGVGDLRPIRSDDEGWTSLTSFARQVLREMRDRPGDSATGDDVQPTV